MQLPAPPPLDGVTHEFVDAAGLRMHVALAGADDAPPLLLLHGWPQNWWVWRKVIPALTSRFRVIAPDLRGHGWTDAPLHGYEKEQLASDILALLGALGVERVTWVGHDWGGYTGFLAALREPQRIDRMLAMCIPHPWLGPDPRRMAMMLGYQGPISLPLLGPPIAARIAPRIIQAGRRDDALGPADVAVFMDHLPRRVSVAMYRTFLTREVVPVARGRYADAVLAGADDARHRCPRRDYARHRARAGRGPAGPHGRGCPGSRPLGSRATTSGRDRLVPARAVAPEGRGPRPGAGRLTGPPRRAARPAPDRSTPGSR